MTMTKIPDSPPAAPIHRRIEFAVTEAEYDELTAIGVAQGAELDHAPFPPGEVAYGLLRVHLPGALRLFGLERVED